jgi:cysteine synthase A
MQYGDESAGEFMVKTTHPAWRPHLMQGWTTDFIPKIVQDAIDAKYIDDVSI